MLSMAMVMVEVWVTDHVAVLTLRFDVKYGHGHGGGVEVSVTDHVAVLTLRFDVKYGRGHGGGVSD